MITIQTPRLMRRFVALSAIVGSLAVTTASAQPIAVSAGEFTKVGLSGGQFLKIGVGARGSAMAGAYSGIANDVSSLFWNAAGIADIKHMAAEVSHTFWFAGMSHSFAAGVVPISDKLRAAVSFTTFSSGDIRVTTTSQPDGTTGIYSVNDVAIGLTIGGYLTEQFAFGVTGKYVQHAFTSASASGFVFDVGTRYNTGYNGVTLGFSVNSLGPEQRFGGPSFGRSAQPIPGVEQQPFDQELRTSSFSMPLSFRAGLGIDMFKGFVADAPETDADGTILHQWIVGADFETFSDVPEQYAIGTEYTFREFISLRAGYRFGHDQFGLSGGVGLKYLSQAFEGGIDYSISPTLNLGLVNRLSVTMRFN